MFCPEDRRKALKSLLESEYKELSKRRTEDNVIKFIKQVWLNLVGITRKPKKSYKKKLEKMDKDKLDAQEMKLDKATGMYSSTA